MHTAGCMIALTACQKQAEDVTVLAEVNGQPITEASFLHWQKESALPPEQLLDQLIERAAAVQLARKMGLAHDPEVMAEIESLLIAKLREREILDVLTQQGDISETEITEYYAANRTSFRSPARLSVAVLWFDTRGQAPLEARYRPRLDEARAAYLQDPQASTGKGFGELARTHSEHTATRYNGGQLGWLELDGTYNEWTRHVLQMARELPEVANVSEVIVNELGSFLVAVSDREASSIRPMDAVKPQIISAINQARRTAAETAFKKKVHQTNRIVTFPDRLQALPAEPSFVDSNLPPSISP